MLMESWETQMTEVPQQDDRLGTLLRGWMGIGSTLHFESCSYQRRRGFKEIFLIFGGAVPHRRDVIWQGHHRAREYFFPSHLILQIQKSDFIRGV